MKKPFESTLILLKITFVILAIAVAIIIFSGCNRTADKNGFELQKRIEFLEETQDYRPGLGSMMLSIQAHHTKLYYASQNSNWKLSSFLIHELEESFEDIQEFHPQHDGIDLKELIEEMPLPILKDLDSAVKNQNGQKFKANFNNLTNLCNSCHAATNHSFIKIQIPEKGSFPNQNFTIKVVKKEFSK